MKYKTCLVAIGFLIFVGPANALTIAKSEFQDSYRAGEADLTLRGAALKRFLMMRIVAVALYFDPDVKREDVLTSVPKSLEVIYFQPIPNTELRNATTKGIKINVSDAEFKKIKESINQLNSYYPNVKPMDRIRVTYVPGEGTTVSVNGTKKGTIPGEDLGRAFFAIWVGKRPVDKWMKASLLGQSPSADEKSR